MSIERRELIASVALGLAGCATPSRGGGGGGEPEVTPGEDLMQEHGLLERVLQIYEESAGRIERGEPVDAPVLASAAAIVKRFVEDYHEKIEEQFVLPRLRAAGREVELVSVILEQHQRGRELTAEVMRRTQARDTGAQVASMLRAFARMYRPHAAREDTVLFPAFREVVGRKAYGELGEQFEAQEHARFGEHGFEDIVHEVAALEGVLGISDLAGFTPA